MRLDEARYTGSGPFAEPGCAYRQRFSALVTILAPALGPILADPYSIQLASVSDAELGRVARLTLPRARQAALGQGPVRPRPARMAADVVEAVGPRLGMLV